MPSKLWRELHKHPCATCGIPVHQHSEICRNCLNARSGVKRTKYHSDDDRRLAGNRASARRYRRYPYKSVATTEIHKAIKDGQIRKRNSCEICLNGPTIGHHEDYRKQLDVIWLCKRCHYTLHKQYRAKGILLPHP